MQLRDKQILLISPEPWDHIFVSKHHYAVHLAKRGNRVFFVNPPGKRESIAMTEYENVFEVNYKRFPMGLRFYPAVLQKKFIRAAYGRLKTLCDSEFQIVWSFDNSVFFDFCIFGKGTLTISHIVDHSQDFNTELAARTASICLCNTDLLRGRLNCYNKNVFLINHGYNEWTDARAVTLPGVNRVKAVYAGNLNIPYLDWVTLYRAVAENPDVDFVFIGPGLDPQHRQNTSATHDKALILSLPNAYAVGKVPADLLHAYLHAADVTLICYQELYQKDQVSNPHKIMEYLGCGKVIVATRTLHYISMEPLIVMSERNSEWPDLFRKVIGDLAYYNSPPLMSRRRSFALENTYEQQIRRIEKMIPLNH